MNETSDSSLAPLQVVLKNASSLTSRLVNINETIPARIRALLASRHERYPPRAPLPSPDPPFRSRSSVDVTQDYQPSVEDLDKRLSILEPPERRHRLISPAFDGSEDGTVGPGFLTKEHLWKPAKPEADPRELMKGLRPPDKRMHHVASDRSEDVADGVFHTDQRPPTLKGVPAAEKPDDDFLKVETTLPRNTTFFQPAIVPWEYGSSNNSAAESRRVSDSKEHNSQPVNMEKDTPVSLPTRKGIFILPGQLRKINIKGTKLPNAHESHHAPVVSLGSPSASLPAPPVLTPGGEHPHGHSQKLSTEHGTGNESEPQAQSKPIAEEVFKVRMKAEQRIEGHNDCRGYRHAAEDSLHAVADKNHVPHDHAVMDKSEGLAQGERRQAFLAEPLLIEKADERALEEATQTPLPYSPLIEKTVEPEAIIEPDISAVEPERVLSSKSSNISSMRSSKKPRAADIVEPAFDNPLTRQRATGSGSPWKQTAAGREWINRLLHYDQKYQSELTARPQRTRLQTPLQINDGSMSDPAQFSDTVHSQQQAPDPFNKTITDLELLLSEALRIAKQAAETDKTQEDVGTLPRLTVPGDRRRSIYPYPTTKVTFVDSHEEPSTSQLRNQRQHTPWPLGTRRSSVAVLPSQPDNSDDSSSPSESENLEPVQLQAVSHDWAYGSGSTSRKPSVPGSAVMPLVPLRDRTGEVERRKSSGHELPQKFSRRPTIQPRVSSLGLHEQRQSRRPSRVTRSEMTSDPLFSSTEEGHMQHVNLQDPEKQEMAFEPRPYLQPRHSSRRQHLKSHLRGFKGGEYEEDGFNRSARRQPVARDWRTSRKRIAAAVACMNTALLGMLIGIYAGEVPAIQYAIVDEHHLAILGNVFFYIGLAIPTLLCWPLPLLHGRKPYTVAAMAILLVLQMPQGIAVANHLSQHIAMYRALLLVMRGLSGLAMGFANMNFQSTLLDLFGASLQSANPHQELVDECDVRRHGGGMGAWLGIWSWCSLGSIASGFFIGAGIIAHLAVSWGFWIGLIMTIVVLILNVVTPEVRRSKHRRTLAEVWTGSRSEKVVQTGEITIHLHSQGARSWVTELRSGLELSFKMLKQPGFLVLCLYTAWVYGQIVLVMVLLGSLTSRDYRYKPFYVGVSVFAIGLGALLAVPFQKGSVFSRSRSHVQKTDSMTFEKRKRPIMSSHLIRRVTFMVLLPLADLAYTLASVGSSLHSAVPTVFAAAIGFFSNMAMAECYGLIMETFDTSDLQAGMIGRPRKRSVTDDIKKLRTPFTCYPRISAAFALCQGFGFLIAAAATGTGGALARRVGDQQATAVVAGILLFLTVSLTIVLWRFKSVAIIPTQLQRAGTAWEPVIIGHPSGKTRKMSLLELGKQSRWTEIRRRNRMTFSE